MLLAALLCSAPLLAVAGWEYVLLRSEDVFYEVRVGGYYSGSGSASRHGSSIILNADIRSESGATGQLNASLVVDGSYFTGQGTILGQRVTLSGRLDNPDTSKPPKSRGIRSARMVGSLNIEDGHRGRIVGLLPIRG